MISTHRLEISVIKPFFNPIEFSVAINLVPVTNRPLCICIVVAIRGFRCFFFNDLVPVTNGFRCFFLNVHLHCGGNMWLVVSLLYHRNIEGGDRNLQQS